MEDSKKERNRSIRALIIGILVLLACVIGAAYAYFSAPSTNNSETSIITSRFTENGVVSLTNPVDSIHIEIQPRDMNESKKGTTYYGTVDPNKQYETEETYHEIAKATVTGGSDNTEYTCKFNLKTTISGTMKDKLKEGDMSITFSGAYTGTYDLTELTETREVTINLSGTNREQSVLAKIEFNNRDAHQRYIAGHTLDIEINNESFSCGGSDIQRITTTEWVFDYTGSEQTFIVPYTGIYKIETWGAQGGSYSTTYYGGYGAYSTGFINLSKNNRLYVNVGGAGVGSTASRSSYQGGYNGGGRGVDDPNNSGDRGLAGSSGGGATHIARESGLLSSLNNSLNNILIVSGGGGGSSNRNSAGNGGGIKGNDGYSANGTNLSWNGYGGTQTSAGNSSSSSDATAGGFGYGASANTWGTGGGGGYYGGGVGGGNYNSAGGGSGYIGNTNLTNKHMTCYNCTTSNEEATKTISNTCVDANPVVDCSKTGNGYAKITYLGRVNKIVTFADGKESEIKKMFESVDAGLLSMKDTGWKVGDERTITLGNPINETVTFVILDIAEGENYGPDGKDNTTSGGTKYHALVGQKNSLSVGRTMNNSNTNSGGYNSSSLKTFIDNDYTNSHNTATVGRIYDLIIPSSHYHMDGGTSSLQLTSDVRFIINSEYEIYKTNHSNFVNGSESSKCKQLEYFKNGDKYYKKLGNNGSVAAYWTRTGNNKNYGHFGTANTSYCISNQEDGNAWSAHAYSGAAFGGGINNLGIAPFGAI